MIAFDDLHLKQYLGGPLCCVVLGLGLAAPVGAGQVPATQPVSIEFGGPCVRGQFALRGYLLVCSDAGTFRYALPADIPPPPAEGYMTRPAWYPRLADVNRSSNPPGCPLLGRITFTSPIVRLDDLSTTVPQGAMIGDHVTPIDHGYIGVRPLTIPSAYIPNINTGSGTSSCRFHAFRVMSRLFSYASMLSTAIRAIRKIALRNRIRVSFVVSREMAPGRATFFNSPVAETGPVCYFP